MASAFAGRLKIIAQLFSFIVLALGAWFAAEGAILHSVLALLIGGFNLVILTRVHLQTASRFFLLVPGTFGFIIGAITLGGIAGLWVQGRPVSPIMALVGVSYILTGICTILWLLLLPPPPAPNANPGE